MRKTPTPTPNTLVDFRSTMALSVVMVLVWWAACGALLYKHVHLCVSERVLLHCTTEAHQWNVLIDSCDSRSGPCLANAPCVGALQVYISSLLNDSKCLSRLEGVHRESGVGHVGACSKIVAAGQTQVMWI
jgi:hypothetical protein